MHRLRRAYRLLFFTEGRLAERIEALEREFGDDPLVGKIVAFVRSGGKRPLMHPRARRQASAADGDSEEASR
jgi:UDP-N-acetylglucosamine acyltransferase